MKVLIIDDDEDLRNILAHYLKQEWPDVAVEQFDPLEREMPDASFPLGSYDVMILDYMLGRGDGLEWLQHFKARAGLPAGHVPHRRGQRDHRGARDEGRARTTTSASRS